MMLRMEMVNGDSDYVTESDNAVLDDDDVDNESGDVDEGDDDVGGDIDEADDVKDGVVKEAEMLRESASTPFTTTILFLSSSL